jgi:hypothetical protein
MAQQIPQHSLAIIRYDTSTGIDQFLVVQGSIYGFINIGEGRIIDFLRQIYFPAAGLQQGDIDALNRWGSVYRREGMTAQQGLDAHMAAIIQFIANTFPGEGADTSRPEIIALRDRRRLVNNNNLTFQQIIDLYGLRGEVRTTRQIIEENLFPIALFPVNFYHLDLTPDSTRCRLMIPREGGGSIGFVKGGIEEGDIIGPNDGTVSVRGVVTPCAVDPTVKRTVIREIGEELGLELHQQWVAGLQPAFQRISIPIGQSRDTRVFLCPLSTDQDKTIKPIIDHYARNRNRNQEIFNPRWVTRQEFEALGNNVNGISREAFTIYRPTALAREQAQAAREQAERARAQAERARLAAAAREAEERARQEQSYADPKDDSNKRKREKYLKYKAKYLHLKKLLEQMKI